MYAKLKEEFPKAVQKLISGRNDRVKKVLDDSMAPLREFDNDSISEEFLSREPSKVMVERNEGIIQQDVSERVIFRKSWKSNLKSH